MRELLLTIDVECYEALNVKGQEKEVVLVQFGGTASGDYFSGSVIGTGTDTQKYDLKSGSKCLSARYILEGRDRDGKQCRIFIENELNSENCWHPMLVTDSNCLSPWEKLALTATVDSTDKGVVVRIYSCT